MNTKRCVIYAKDIQLITGRSIRYSHEVIRKIRHLTDKSKGQYVTLTEFSAFSGIPESELSGYIH
jgi:hypothetical protein